MKVFKCGLNDCSRSYIIVADDIHKAIDLYKQAEDIIPERIKEISEDDQYLIVQGMIEPIYNINDIPF